MQQVPPPPRICPKYGSTMSQGFVAVEMHPEDANRVNDTVRGFTCNNCGYQEKAAVVNEQERIGGEKTTTAKTSSGG